MQYPIQCSGGFPVPIVAGKMEITGLRATIDDVDLASGTAQIALFDDAAIPPGDKFGRLIAVANIYTTPTLLCDVLVTNVGTPANSPVDGNIEVIFSEPIKTRFGLSLAASNIKAGSICVYRR